MIYAIKRKPTTTFDSSIYFKNLSLIYKKVM